MIRNLLALALLAFALSAQASDIWSGLWRNADQRGETLLQHGDAAAAAKVYSDPRRKAYAELKAGDYPAAARDFSGFDDGDAHYNRGNALAHAGDLQGALNAYDAALKRDPNNQDAKHNRELVANALKQKPPQEQGSGSDKSKDEKQAGKQAGNQASSSPDSVNPGEAGKEGQQGKQSGPGANGKDDQQAQSFAKNQAQAGKAGDHASAGPGQPAPAQTTPGDASAQQGKMQQDGKSNAGAASQPTQTAQGQRRDDADQARRDAAASLASTQGKTDRTGIGEDAKSKGVQPAIAALSEKQLAQDQWLRSIPDDPGGLLRRKFLIEHLMRQQRAQP